MPHLYGLIRVSVTHELSPYLFSDELMLPFLVYYCSCVEPQNTNCTTSEKKEMR